jgi:hypothetical protein
MAITTTTISIYNGNTGWGRSDVIIGIQTALSWLGVLDPTTDVGIVTGIQARIGGGTVTGQNNTSSYYYTTSTSISGVGTDATFIVYRYNGSINSVNVVNPGYGYTNGERLTISAEDIGGSANGATGIAITAFAETATSYGSSTSYYDYDYSGSYPWGVARYVVNPNKKYGKTYFGFQTYSNNNLVLYSGSAFFPHNGAYVEGNNRHGYPNRFSGAELLDVPGDVNSSANTLSTTDINTSRYYSKVSDATTVGLTYSSGNAYKLDLNIFRSGIDPKFAVLSFKQPTLSSTKLRDNTYLTFFIHNYETTLWDLDYLFLEGITEIFPSTNENDPYLTFRTYIGGNHYYSNSNYYVAKRAAESGYLGKANYNTTFIDTSYKSTLYTGNTTLYSDRTRFYSRRTGEGIDSSQNFNAVIKGIPLSINMIPVPYYLPDDFVLIDFRYEAPSANIQQGDTITVSGSEVYTVIQGSYNQTVTTRGVLFCARTV